MGNLDQSKKKNTNSNSDNDACPDYLTLFHFIEGNFPSEKNQTIMSHLNSCRMCFEAYTSYIKFLQHFLHASADDPAHKPDKSRGINFQRGKPEIPNFKSDLSRYHRETPKSLPKEQGSESLGKAEAVSWDAQFKLIREYIAEDKHKRAATKPSAAFVLEEGPKGWGAFLRYFSVLMIFRKYFNRKRFAGLTTALLSFIFIAGIFVAVGYLVDYFTTGPADQIKILLEDNHRQYYKLAQLANVRGVSRISVHLSDPDSLPVYHKEARAIAARALQKNVTSKDFLYQYARLLIIEKKYAQADSVIRKILLNTKASAEILNDIGVIQFMVQEQIDPPNFPNYDRAEKFFYEAHQRNPSFKQALYNLLLVKARRKDRPGFENYLREYKKIEKNLEWQQAAESLFGVMQGEN